MKSKQTTRTLCEGAIMVAMAVVLNFFKFDLFAQGGSMNLLFIPLMVFALRRGPVWGMGAGLVFGVLKGIISGLGISGGTGEEDHSLAEYGLSVLNEVL